mgnify:CR=1 FL=1
MLGTIKSNKLPRKAGASILAFLLGFLLLFGGIINQSFKTYLEADVNGAIRGQSYDLWADKVLGKRDFGEIMPREIVADKVSLPGGVIVDRSVSPGRAYIWDSGNSRILGINLADCYATANNERCTGEIVIGQPNLNDYGSCNQDASFQYYPNSTPASASTLCGVPEWTHTTLEHKTFTSMFVDSEGNLYVADVGNNRVLKYISPFTTDQIADEVWGQADFTGTYCNLTGKWGDETPAPTASSMCFNSTFSGGAGVAVDSDGNLWVADGGNYRVLRFPFDSDTNTVSKTADIVIGNSNFTSTNVGNGANQLASPTSVRFASNGDLYIADAGNERVQVFRPPFSSGMNALSTVLDTNDFEQGLVAIEMFPNGNGFWTYENEGAGAGFRDWDLTGTHLGHHFANWNPGGGSLGIDDLGNILVSAYVYQQDVARFTYDSQGDSYAADKSFFYPPGGYNLTSARRLEQGGWGGVVAVSNQLLVSDGRLMYWNNPLQTSSGQTPDGFLSANSGTDFPNPGYSILKPDKNNRVYAARGTNIEVIETPVNSSSTPIKTLTPPFNAAGGGTVDILNTIGGLAPTNNGEYLWVSNPDNNRVFRIRGPLTENPVVDVVIGQTSLNGTSCNKGIVAPPNVDGNQQADRTMLCIPGALSIDNLGNLFISDHFFESAGNWRLLMYSPDLFPATPSNILFNVVATKEFPRVGVYGNTSYSHATFEVAFDSTNRMVTGYNPYLGPRFIEFYNNPTTFNPSNRSDPSYTAPSGRFKDFYGWAFGMTFDSEDNLYVYDSNRGKILIYLDPFGTAPVDNGGNNGGNGNNNGNNNNQNNNNNNYSQYFYYGDYTNKYTATSTVPTKPTSKPTSYPVSFVAVNEEIDVPIETSLPPIPTTNTNVQQPANSFNSVMGVLTELAKNINPEAPLLITGVGLVILILLFTISLLLAGASLLDVLNFALLNSLKFNKKYWGIVYSTSTDKTIPYAKVALLKKEKLDDNAFKTTYLEKTFTDNNGRFKFKSVASKANILEVKALGYDSYLKSISSSLDINLNLIKESSLLKRAFAFNKNLLIKFLRFITVICSILGYISTIYNQVSNPDITNIILIALYSLLFIIVSYPTLYSFFLRKVYVVDSNNKPVKTSVVRMYLNNELVDLTLTNKKGIAKMNLEEGIYRVVAAKEGYAFSEAQVEIHETNIPKAEIVLNSLTNPNPAEKNLDLEDNPLNINSKFNLH